MTEDVLAVRNVSKRFPNVLALENASLDIRRGEVHCLVGANGAGKSTLLKIIAGAYTTTSGEIMVEGAPRHFRSPHEAAAAGISMIYQELDLVPQLTVEQNLMLGRAPARWGIVDRRSRRRVAERALERIGAGFGANTPVGKLSIANQQLTAIARSLTMDAKVIIMDEPSAALNETELERVFDVVREITAQGVSILYVSHRLNEIREIGDRVTVLRGGRTIDTFDVTGVDEPTLVSAVIGDNRSLVERTRGKATFGEVALDVARLDAASGLSIRDLKVRQGEIVGLTGLAGSGRTTFLRALFGVEPFSGDVTLDGRPYRPKKPTQAIRRGVALVPESRKTDGLILDAAIYRNAVLPSLRRRRLIQHERMRREAQPVLSGMSTRYGSMDQPIRQLSGGNQQKVVLAKWIIEGSHILLLDEPSRGLDVGAKAELYALIRQQAESGATVLVASSELDEIYANTDKIWVFHEGRNVKCFDPGTSTRDDILKASIVGD